MDNVRLETYTPFAGGCENSYPLQQRDYPKVEFKLKEGKEGHVLHIRSPMLQEHNYKLSLKGNCLSLIINEKREFVKSIRTDVLPKNTPRTSVYERLRNFKYSLPDSDFELGARCWNSDRNELEVNLVRLN